MSLTVSFIGSCVKNYMDTWSGFLFEWREYWSVVAIKVGIISLSLSLSSVLSAFLQERVIVGFRNFAWAPK